MRLLLKMVRVMRLLECMRLLTHGCKATTYNGYTGIDKQKQLDAFELIKIIILAMT